MTEVIDYKNTDEEVRKQDEVEKVDLDRILVEEVGQFGIFQMRMTVLVGLAALFSSWGAGEYIFTTARISTRCLIPECDSASPEFSPWWIEMAVPSSGGTLDGCYRYGINSTVESIDTCSREQFDTSVLLPCEEYVYENTNTVVYDFNLGCNEWRRSFIGSIRIIGTLISLNLTGYISDRWGRRTAFLFNSINSAWLGLVRYWANTYVGFAVSQFMETIFGFGTFSTANILLMEIVGPKYRVVVGAAMTTFHALGQTTVALIASVVPHWRDLILVLYIPQFLTVFNIWFVKESLRWYMCKGKYAESEALLQYIAKANGKAINTKTLELLKQTAEEENRKKVMEKQEKPEWIVSVVFRHKPILYRVVTNPIVWISTTLIYYGMSINAINMTGNMYWNYVAVTAIEIPGFFTVVYLMGKVGRRPVLVGAFWICCACQVVYIFMPNDMYGLSLAVYLVGKFNIAMVATGIYVYTTELFPTKYRHSLFGFSCMTGRIGSIIAPLTPAFGASTFPEMPFVLFGGFALLSGVLVLTTPETLGIKLPDTMEDADNLGKNHNTNNTTA